MRATAAGLVPLVGPRQAPAEAARRHWLKRLGGLLTGTALAAPALAAPRQVTGSQPYIGEIMLFAGNFAPQGWAFCDGSLLSIADNTALFTLIGTIYGGDGQTTFGLPDLRGRAPRHFGQGPGTSSYVLGQEGGAETHTLTTAEMTAHGHPFVADLAPVSATPVGNIASAQVGTDVNGEAVPVLAYTAPGSPSNGLANAIQPTGGSQPFGIMPTSLAMNYCISLFGIYPPT
ncbi:phage tail protein [Hymenobacter rubidus]|uniref:phage tail protein n=1 Tax=Hymenobacter rubidus TaxID=1441626 RepID=UPI001F428989|nr:tail fiber protein [Hymenobacter rubidus]